MNALANYQFNRLLSKQKCTRKNVPDCFFSSTIGSRNEFCTVKFMTNHERGDENVGDELSESKMWERMK